MEQNLDTLVNRIYEDGLQKAQKEAEKDREKLLAIQGEDVNEDASRVDLIRKI